MMTDDSDGQSQPKLNVRAASAPIQVPVFNVVIYVSQVEGQVRAEVVNLPDLSFTASSEPQALKQAITKVKSLLAGWHASSEAIPWIDPVRPPTKDEQQRLVPVHL